MCEKYFYKVAENVPDYNLLKLIPEGYQQDFYRAHGPVSFLSRPHIVENMVTLNLYTEDIPYKVTFYETKTSDPIKISKIPFHIRGSYIDEEVYEVDSFIAKSGDLWLVDLSKIHSFSSTDESRLQKAIQLKTTEFTFDEVIKMLKLTGAIQDVWLG